MNPVQLAGSVQNATASIPRAAIARSFGDAAGTYDAYAELQRTVADHLLAQLPDGKPQQILDIGCGTGYCAAQIGKRFPRATLFALDLAMPMLRVAATTVPGAGLVCADAQALPLAADAFDLVASSLTLQWCADPLPVMQELHRILKPGATALVSTFGPASLETLRQSYSRIDTGVHVNAFLPLQYLEQSACKAGLQCSSRVETEVRHYSSLLDLARELKGIGAHNLNSGRPLGLTGRQKFMRAAAAFLEHGQPGKGVPVAYEILYLALTKPVAEAK